METPEKILMQKELSEFFNRWTPEMAYVLGFFAADGSMYENPRGSKYVSFYSAYLAIIDKIRNVIGVSNAIGKRTMRTRMKHPGYVLQIGSKQMFERLIRLGFTPRKSTTLLFPKIPSTYLPHFIRGYFDGDGNVTISVFRRKDRGNRAARTMLSGFTSGSRQFLVDLRKSLAQYAGMGNGTLYFANRGHRLYYSVNDSKKLSRFMYPLTVPSLFLNRKKAIFARY